MQKRKKRRIKGLEALLAGVLMVFVSGCDLEVINPGAITDEALDDPTLMTVVANGVANEFSNLVDDLAFDFNRMTDESAGTGSYFETGRLRRGAVDWDETGGEWGQVHETIWTGLAAWDRMSSLEEFDESTSPLAARVWLLIGLSHRIFGESFCEVIYSVGPSPEEPELGGVLPRTAAFDSAVVALERAVSIGNAAGADEIVTAARGGLAQAHAARGDWAAATAQSTQVPTDFVYEARFNRNANSNLTYFETHERPEMGLYATYAGTLPEQDPRVPYTVCGVFDNPDDPKNSSVTPTGASGCTSHQGADGVTAHFQQDKFDDWGSDIPVVKGTEMRLIEAEAALEAGDLATFAARINDVRNFHGLDDLTGVPSSVGQLEYPNAYNATTGDVTEPGVDARSILDAERYLTLWGEGRRTWDLHRWDHPFLDGGIVFWDAEARRASCFPIPEIECTLNPEIQGAALKTGVGDQTQTCG